MPTKLFFKKIVKLANEDDADDWGCGCGFGDKELCKLVGGEFLCLCDNHLT